MGLFGKGLIGLIMENKRRNEFISRVNNASYKNYQCRYCGKRQRADFVPNPQMGGKCHNSPYGTHYWMEY